MFRFLIITSLLIRSLSLPVFASENRVVINSFRIAGESSTDEYVEIVNYSDKDIDLFGWRLSKKTASGNISHLVTSFPQIYLEPGASIIIAHQNCLCSADLNYSTSNSIAADNTILLFSDNGKNLVDKVGFGLALDFESEPIANPNELEVYRRKNDGQDTDNNKNDFFLFYKPPLTESKKTNSEGQQDKSEPSKSIGVSSVKIVVTEFLPNPEGPDSENEFIEIKNIGKKAEIGGFYLADILGSPKYFKIPIGTTIEKSEYLAFYSSKTPISLNNDGDGIQFLDPNKKVLDSSPDDCGKASEGVSYALDENSGKWVWTEVPTPGKANIIKSPKIEDDEAREGGESSIKKLDYHQIENGEVKGDFYTKEDRLIGVAFLVVVIIIALGYTFYSHREKIFEFYKSIRCRNKKTGRKIRERLKGR